MGIKIIAKHKRATFDYSILETFEAGLMLAGTEVKVLRMGKVNIAESHIDIKNDEAYIMNMNIPHYDFGNQFNHEEKRTRKLLLNKKEIQTLKHRMKSESLAIIPLKIYFKKSLVKIEIALGKGKKNHDKRQDQAKKDVERKLQKRQYD